MESEMNAEEDKLCDIVKAASLDPFSEFRTAARSNFDNVNLKRPMRVSISCRQEI
jgi:hypothetical protein